MKGQIKITFAGDSCWGTGVESSPHLASDLLLVRFPKVDFSFQYQISKNNTAESLLANRSRELLGASPDFLIFFLGSVELLHERTEEDFFRPLEKLLNEVRVKSHAKLRVVNLPALSHDESTGKRAECFRWNSHLASLLTPSEQIDFGEIFEEFLLLQTKHKNNLRSLHLSATELTSLGKTLLAESICSSLDIVSLP